MDMAIIWPLFSYVYPCVKTLKGSVNICYQNCEFFSGLTLLADTNFANRILPLLFHSYSFRVSDLFNSYRENDYTPYRFDTPDFKMTLRAVGASS